MRKLKFLVLLIVPFALFVGCSKGSQTYGPAGKAGATGSQGPGLQGIISTENLELSTATVFHGASPLKYALYKFQSDTALKYMLNVYVSKAGTNAWYQLPYENPFTIGDELYASLSEDSVKIWYYNPSGWPFDSVMSCRIIIVPSQSK